MIVQAVINTWSSQSGSNPSADRQPSTSAVARPKASGVAQRTRSQPGPVRRRSPRRGGGGTWTASCSCSRTLTATLTPPRRRLEVLDEPVDLLAAQRLAERAGHHAGRIAPGDLSVGVHDRLADEVRVLARERLVEIRADFALRAGVAERVAAAAVLDEQRLALNAPGLGGEALLLLDPALELRL